MVKILLIRHGESKANRNNLFAGSYNADLEDKGIEQARLTAKYIAENYKVDRVYSSNLIRAHKTAEIIAEQFGIPVITTPNLSEIFGGVWEGVCFSDIIEKYPEEYGIWKNSFATAICPGGESVQEVGERVMAAITEIAEGNDGKTVAIISHATSIRTFECLAKKGDISYIENYPYVSNASVSVFTYDIGKWGVEQISHDSHLAQLRTVLSSKI